MANLGTAANMLSTPADYDMNMVAVEKMVALSMTPISEPSTKEKFIPIIAKKFDITGMMRSIKCSRLFVATRETSGNGENLTRETVQYWG